MKATDLRIDNWINPDFPIQVCAVYPGCVDADFEGNQGDPWEFKNDEIKPIPLNKEWLEKLGFEKSTVGYYAYKSDLYSDYAHLRISDVYDNGKYTVSIGDDKVGICMLHIEYVHQLQNLYYAITSEELEVKL